MWSVRVLGARVMGGPTGAEGRILRDGAPGTVLLSPATITSTPLLITFVARNPRPSSTPIGTYQLLSAFHFLAP